MRRCLGFAAFLRLTGAFDWVTVNNNGLLLLPSLAIVQSFSLIDNSHYLNNSNPQSSVCREALENNTARGGAVGSQAPLVPLLGSTRPGPQHFLSSVWRIQEYLK